MSEFPDLTNQVVVPREVDLAAWVEAARGNRDQHRDRQVAEILLHAIGLTPSLRSTLVLKGGALMSLAYSSLRLTGDLDFSATAEPAGYEEMLRKELNSALETTPLTLGYVDLVCRIQSIERKPRPQQFTQLNFPALLVRIASAVRDTPQHKALLAGHASKVLEMEISFRDPVYASGTIVLDSEGASIRTFGPTEVVAEKYRALLQQPIRHRNRRQDVYDIAYLIDAVPEELNPRIIGETILLKCESRNISPTRDSMRNPEVRERASKNWETMAAEIADLPDFDATYEKVCAFYEALPWDTSN